MKRQLKILVLGIVNAALASGNLSCYKEDFVYINEERMYIIAVHANHVDAVFSISGDTMNHIPMYGDLNIEQLREDFQFSIDSLGQDSLEAELDRQTDKIIGWRDTNGDDENYRLAIDGSRWTWSRQVLWIKEEI